MPSDQTLVLADLHEFLYLTNYAQDFVSRMTTMVARVSSDEENEPFAV